jgi:cellulose synthase/poly-beta-1,6-N-acetylglucosamine synthase-like glycosyltransferase
LNFSTTLLTLNPLTNSIISLFLAISIFYVFLAWNAKKPVRTAHYFPSVTAMAYAWQSGNVIERKIKDFFSQDYPSKNLEIIIYDNDSTDETSAICRKYEEKGLIKYYRPKRPHDRKTPVLDEAIENEATGQIIALTDPDGVCEKEWVKEIVQPFSDPEVGAVAGITHCGNWHKNLFARLRAVEDEWWNNISFLARDGKVRITKFQPLCGCNYAFRRTTWEDIGRSHGTSLLEDLEVSLKLHQKGWRLAVADANVWQEEVENIDEYLRQRRRWYSFKSLDIVNGDGKLDRIIGSLPQGIQMTALFSLLTFLVILTWNLFFFRIEMNETLFAASPFLLHNLGLMCGLFKAAKARFIPHVPIFLTADALLQLWCFVDVRLCRGEEPKWVRLASGKYYHVGSELRMD